MNNFRKNTSFFCCKGGIVHKALFGSPPLNVSKRGVPCDLKSWRYLRKVDTCLAFFSPAFWLSLKLISVRAFSSPLRRSVSVANLSQGWFHARRHELKSIRTMKLQQNTCITLLKTIAWIFSLKRSPESGLLSALDAARKPCGNSGGTSARRLAFQFQLKLIQSPISYSIHCATWCL